MITADTQECNSERAEMITVLLELIKVADGWARQRKIEYSDVKIAVQVLAGLMIIRPKKSDAQSGKGALRSIKDIEELLHQIYAKPPAAPRDFSRFAARQLGRISSKATAETREKGGSATTGRATIPSKR